MIVKVDPSVSKDELLNILDELGCELIKGKFSNKPLAISDYIIIQLPVKSSEEVLKKLQDLYLVDEFLAAELPRTYETKYDGVTIENYYTGIQETINDPILANDIYDQMMTPNRSFAKVFDAWRYNQGAGVKVAVIDGGFNVGHPDIAANITDSIDLATGLKSGLLGGSDFASNHGTTIAGLLVGVKNNGDLSAGIVPEAELTVIKYSERNSSVKLIEALQYIIDNNIKVVSSSIRMDFESTSDRSSALDQMFYTMIHDHDVIWVQSTSNCSNDCTIADDSHVYPVALQSKNPVDFKNKFLNVAGLYTTVSGDGYEPLQKALGFRGPEINIAYPAYNNRVYHFQGYTSTDGANDTSWATPAVAGIVTLLRSQMLFNRGDVGTIDEIISILQTCAQRDEAYDPKDVNKNIVNFVDNYNEVYGFGIPDALTSVSYIENNFGSSFNIVPTIITPLLLN